MEKILDRFKLGQCDYCSIDLDRSKFDSEWVGRGEQHYKCIDCSCGKKNWVKMNFEGSGHDPVLKRKFSKLESSLKNLPGNIPLKD